MQSSSNLPQSAPYLVQSPSVCSLPGAISISLPLTWYKLLLTWLKRCAVLPQSAPYLVQSPSVCSLQYLVNTVKYLYMRDMYLGNTVTYCYMCGRFLLYVAVCSKIWIGPLPQYTATHIPVYTAMWDMGISLAFPQGKVPMQKL